MTAITRNFTVKRSHDRSPGTRYPAREGTRNKRPRRHVPWAGRATLRMVNSLAPLNITLRSRKATLGRSRMCEVTLIERHVSSRHAQLRFDGTRWMLWDLQSRNGTFVNNQRIDKVELKHGDVIAVGGHRLRFSWPKPTQTLQMSRKSAGDTDAAAPAKATQTLPRTTLPLAVLILTLAIGMASVLIAATPVPIPTVATEVVAQDPADNAVGTLQHRAVVSQFSADGYVITALVVQGDSKVRWVEVEAEHTDRGLRITSGLKPGDRVIVGPSDVLIELRDGDYVAYEY